MDDPTLSGFSDSTTSGMGNIVGYGGYGAGRMSGGWSGGLMPSIGGYSQGILGSVLPAAAAAASQMPQRAPQGLSAPLQALISAHLRRMLSGQGQAPQPPKANFAALLGQPQQATPAPFGQPAQFGGQGPPGGGAPNLKMNSPGP